MIRANTTYSSVIPRLIKNMIPMAPNTLPPEKSREPVSGRNLRFWYNLVSAFGLIDDEFTDLQFSR
jgi:hypothetical protein